MSRLYTRTKSDSRKNDATTCGHEHVTTYHYWGSADNSMQMVCVDTKWDRYKSKPSVEITLGYGIDYIVTDVTGNVLTELN